MDFETGFQEKQIPTSSSPAAGCTQANTLSGVDSNFCCETLGGKFFFPDIQSLPEKGKKKPQEGFK